MARKVSVLKGKRVPGHQCCGTVTIYYGSGSGSDIWKVAVPVPTFAKLRTVHVPVPYLDHKKHCLKKFVENFLLFYILCFYKEDIDKFRQIYCKMWMKKF